jgi:aspartyl-tRNA(Asn)/glutamyl-tRNA(Gln) amidotransferase subunit B
MPISKTRHGTANDPVCYNGGSMTHSDYEPVIGLEIHAELQTLSKMFCSCSADYAASPEPNTLICPVCTAQPGALPVVNRQAVNQAILVGLALNCSINRYNVFARKNYFYPDLPKGYQISQYDLPLASEGWLEIEIGEEAMRIRVRRVHLEEDTAKLAHRGATVLVDFNRAGVPLLEIVSEPDMHSVEETLEYASQIRAILRYLGVNSGDMEKGVLRFEANISVRPRGSHELNTRTEIKNLNSFRSLARASTYEIQRQIAVTQSGGRIEQETLGWDEAHGHTTSQRSKEHAHDYRYFPEPDLPPLDIDPAWVEQVRAQIPELPAAKRGRFVDVLGLPPADAGVLTSEKALADYFEATVAVANSPARTVSNWIVGELLRLVNDRGLDENHINLPPKHLAELVDLTTDKIITQNTAKELLLELFDTGQEPKAMVIARGLGQITDEGVLGEVISQVITKNPEPVASYLNGKETVFKWLMGQVAQATRGKANPQIASRLLSDALRRLTPTGRA